MPRRASSGISRGQMIGLSAVVLGILVVAFLFMRVMSGGIFGSSDSKISATELSIADYLENANSLRGNVYQVSGTIEEQLRWTTDNGRLFSLETANGGESSPIPIRVPQEFSTQNIDRGAEFRFVVEVGKDGLLIVKQIEKI